MATSLADALSSTGMIPPVPASDLAPKNKAPSSLDDRLDAALEKLDKQEESLSQASDEVSQGIKQRQEKRNSLEIPKIPELTSVPKSEQRDPLQAFGSAAGWLAVFGSVLARQPITTSLNAAAGVMNAWKQQDAQKAKEQFDIWKSQTDNAIKLHGFAQDYYKDEMDRLKAGDDSALNDLRAKALALKDSSVVTLADLKDRDGILRHQESVDKMNEKMLENQGKLIAIQNYKEWEVSPEGQKATPEQKAKKYMEMTSPIVVATEIRAEASTEAKNEKEIDSVNSALDQLADIKKAVQTGGGLGVTGLAGMAQRLEETVETAVPGGGAASTPASDLESKIDALKLQLPKLLTGSSKSAADERNKVDTILRGLKPGDTQAKTINAIDQLEKLFKDKKDKASKESSKYSVGDTVDGPEGKKYKITGYDTDGTPLGEEVQ